MSCKECRYYEAGYCYNQDTIIDRIDRACIGFEPRTMKCKDCRHFDGIDHCFYYEAAPLEECFACMAYEKEEEEKKHETIH